MNNFDYIVSLYDQNNRLIKERLVVATSPGQARAQARNWLNNTPGAERFEVSL